MYVQLLVFSCKAVTVEYFKPNVMAGALFGILCMGSAVRSRKVREKGRSIGVASVPILNGYLAAGT